MNKGIVLDRTVRTPKFKEDSESLIAIDLKRVRATRKMLKQMVSAFDGFYSRNQKILSSHHKIHITKYVFVFESNASIDYNTEMYKDFEKFKSYKDNWDGEGSLAMTKAVRKNFVKLYSSLSKDIIDNMYLDLDENGTILLETSDGKSGIEIGNDAFTYFYFEKNELKGQEHVPFKVDSVISTAKLLISKME